MRVENMGETNFALKHVAFWFMELQLREHPLKLVLFFFHLKRTNAKGNFSRINNDIIK